VCGSDLHLYNAEIMQLKEGDILGHEFCGVVESVGSEVKHIKPGQRVVVSFQIACGQCEYCKRGLSSMCDTTNKSSVQNAMYGHRFAGLFGYSHFAGGFSGGQSEYVRVPFAETNLLPIPEGVPDEKALYLSDIVSTSYHACKRAHIKKGTDVVGIWGLGPIGLLCAQWCKLMGARRVIGIDNVEERLKFARERLGIETINFDDAEKGDTVKQLQALVPGGLDKTIDCAAFRYAKGMLHKVERALALETDTSEIVNEQIKCVKKVRNAPRKCAHIPQIPDFGLVLCAVVRVRSCSSGASC
jgi:threonine dehydrogenase-like Zn-dependent dehydrogenase